MGSDIFLAWLTALVCLLASIERPDRYMFWIYAAWFCIGVNVSHFVIGASS